MRSEPSEVADLRWQRRDTEAAEPELGQIERPQRARQLGDLRVVQPKMLELAQTADRIRQRREWQLKQIELLEARQVRVSLAQIEFRDRRGCAVADHLGEIWRGARRRLRARGLLRPPARGDERSRRGEPPHNVATSITVELDRCVVGEHVVTTAGHLHVDTAKGLVHRDIKPANIMLCERGAMPDVAKVLDFGLVKHVTADQGDTKQIIIGTPAYLAPEAATDPNHITSAADIYSLGAVAYFLLTGRRVFEGKTAIDICVQHATMTPAPLPNVAATLASVVMSCLAKAPDERPSAAVLAESLRSLAAVDWSESQAQAWWTDFSRRRQAVPRSTNTTETITVDLGRRADVDDRTALN